MWNFFKEYGQQIFFGAVGLIFLSFSFYSLYGQDVAGASATFAMAFLCFIYSNVSRFKRFKGLGFEAELWEDKQKEAEHLIDRLKAVVSVYTREVVVQKVMQGRGVAVGLNGRRIGISTRNWWPNMMSWDKPSTLAI